MTDDNQTAQYEIQATLGPAGRVLIPAKYRKAMGIKPGDPLLLTLKNHKLEIMTQKMKRNRAKQIAATFGGPDRMMSDELIAERRLEAENE